jgi:Co/Zn/Cd efflux system component
VLSTVLAINAVMFAVEVIAGVAAGSASLQADALDFLGDAANYAVSLSWPSAWLCAFAIPRRLRRA